MLESDGPKTFWRMHAPQDWSRVQQQMLRGCLGLNSEVRMLVTIRNKWDCYIPCVMQVRFEVDESRSLSKITQSYMVTSNISLCLKSSVPCSRCREKEHPHRPGPSELAVVELSLSLTLWLAWSW